MPNQKEFYEEKNSNVTISSRKIKIINLVSSVLAPNRSVLDIGCGDGFLSFVMSLTSKSVTGCDLAPPKEALSPNVSYVESDISKSKLNGEYDVVTCFDVLEHIEDLEAGLVNIKAALKKGGALIVNHPEHHDPSQPIDNEITVLELIKKINMKLIKLEYYGFTDEAYYFMIFVEA